jgi:hypothetical protein
MYSSKNIIYKWWIWGLYVFKYFSVLTKWGWSYTVRDGFRHWMVSIFYIIKGIITNLSQSQPLPSGGIEVPEETPPKVDPNRAIKMEKLKQLQKVVQNLVQLRRLQLYKKVHEAKNPSACSLSS